MLPLSCTNCWHNALQYGSVGLSVGYCTQHRCILKRAAETTCGRHMRKDLTLANVRRQHESHRQVFGDGVVVLRTREADGTVTSTREKDLDLLRADDVGEVVTEYAQLDARIEAVAQLRRIPGARAELALLSLARAYVDRCVESNVPWTSGIHLLWWTRERLGTVPDITVRDLLEPNSLPLDRQVELARWSLIMLRLTFVTDMAHHAEGTGHPVTRLSALTDEAAEAVQTFSHRRLLSWIRRVALREIDRALPRRRYAEIARELQRFRDRAADGTAA